MSPLLQQYFDEIGEWVDNGARRFHPCFNNESGLCPNLSLWYMFKNRELRDSDPKLYIEGRTRIASEFEDLLIEDFGRGNTCWPFNTCREHYWQEVHEGTVFENLARLAWLNKHRSCPGESGIDT